MYKKHVGLLLLVVVGMLPGCAAMRTLFDNPLVVNQGPGVVRDATAVFTQVALTKNQAPTETAERIKQHLKEAGDLFMTGQPPATALDELAAYLNTKIENAFVRSAVQQGILLLKNQVVLPTEGLLSTEALNWVKGVLDGGIAGCDAYIAGKAVSASGQVTISAPDRISFRDTRASLPNDGWVNFRR